RRLASSCRSAVHDQGNAVSDLIAYARGMRTFRIALEIRGGRRDRQSKGIHHSPWNRSVGNADRNVAGFCRAAQWQPRAGPNNKRQRPWPEALRQLVEMRPHLARKFISLGYIRDQK